MGHEIANQVPAAARYARPQNGGLLHQRKQGRHRYYALSGDDIGDLLEKLMSVAVRTGQQRTRRGPTDQALRSARICYDHLAGDMGIQLYNGLLSQDMLREAGGEPMLTKNGERFVTGLGLPLARLSKARRPFCKACLDWSARKTHLAGGLGAAFLVHFLKENWAVRDKNSRAITFSRQGTKAFEELFVSDAR